LLRRGPLDVLESGIIISGNKIQGRKENFTMIGLDLFILTIASTAAITLVGFAAKAYDILRKDFSRE
jgi:hypothetical protein